MSDASIAVNSTPQPAACSLSDAGTVMCAHDILTGDSRQLRVFATMVGRDRYDTAHATAAPRAPGALLRHGACGPGARGGGGRARSARRLGVLLSRAHARHRAPGDARLDHMLDPWLALY